MTKSGWRIGIALGIGGFVLAIAIMVVISLSSPTELVTDRYYERGVAYQEQITTLQRTGAREEKLTVALEKEGITIVFPRRDEIVPLSGTILLYRPSDKSRDRSVPVLPDSTGSQRIPSAGLERGLWTVKVSWKEKGMEYYGEKQVMLR